MTRPLPSMLALVRPQLPTLPDAPPVGPGWRHEIKHAGHRTLAFVRGQRARLVSHGGYDWTARY